MATSPASERTLIEIPVDWALDDWEQYAFYPGVTGSGVIESPAKVLEMWTLEAEAPCRRRVLRPHEPSVHLRKTLQGSRIGTTHRERQGNGRDVGDHPRGHRGTPSASAPNPSYTPDSKSPPSPTSRSGGLPRPPKLFAPNGEGSSIVDRHPVLGGERGEIVFVPLTHRAETPLPGASVDLGEMHRPFGRAGVQNERCDCVVRRVDGHRDRTEFTEGAISADRRRYGHALVVGVQGSQFDPHSLLAAAVAGQFHGAVRTRRRVVEEEVLVATDPAVFAEKKRNHVHVERIVLGVGAPRRVDRQRCRLWWQVDHLSRASNGATH
ncbi:hydrolase [Rhodococcus opacus RKJ300 = JCM 13270]|uniref:Hydrolase n=1 Tax=Rhodococcus opacus RKJ300 = JCM 13270 TaxID=1165867 RepID=I0WCJ1_RHOOP|nr:hydrolase [Rhodococcus opacus RKJ300 = JCM 13270]